MGEKAAQKANSGDKTVPVAAAAPTLEALKMRQMRELHELQLQHLRQLHEQQLALAAAEREKEERDRKEQAACCEAEVLEEICKQHGCFFGVRKNKSWTKLKQCLCLNRICTPCLNHLLIRFW